MVEESKRQIEETKLASGDLLFFSYPYGNKWRNSMIRMTSKGEPFDNQVNSPRIDMKQSRTIQVNSDIF